MNILALYLGHTSTAALGVDGRIVAAISQEKVDNVKNSAAFPGAAAQWCLECGGLSAAQVDQVVVAGRDVYPARSYAYLSEARQQQRAAPIVHAARYLEDSALGTPLKPLFGLLREGRRRVLLAEGAAELAAGLAHLGLGGVPCRHLDHHDCHARAAFHGLDTSGGDQPGLVLTLDGSGDGIAGSVTTWRPDEGWRRLAAIPMGASLGSIYSHTTRFLGMRMLEHEYKVMGLAPYAKSYYLDTYRRVFADLITPDPVNPLSLRCRIDATRFHDHLIRHAVGERFDNLAAAVQHLVETVVVDWVKTAVARTGIRRLFTGGGLFMNVKLNKLLQELPELESCHFMPSAGDESLPIGAAYGAFAGQGVATVPMAGLYLGPEYGEEAILAALAGWDELMVERPDDLIGRVADLLASGEVVARVAGRSEWGARSLGNRAILAHPGRMESFYQVNDRIKVRDFWMPFAPSILDRRAADYLVGYDPVRTAAPHMITAFQASDRGVRDLRAALHQGDHTLRPQVVTPQANPEYYRLIEAFEARTGIGGLLNTSLNLHGYPLAATPEQALLTLTGSDLNHLAIGPFLVSKRSG